jgi:hypothetical protein
MALQEHSGGKSAEIMVFQSYLGAHILEQTPNSTIAAER